MKPSTAATGSDVELNYRGCAITEEATGTYAATIRVSGRFSPRRSHCSFHFVGQRRRVELKKKRNQRRRFHPAADKLLAPAGI